MKEEEQKILMLKRRLMELEQRLINPKKWTQGECEIFKSNIKEIRLELLKYNF